MKFILVIIVMLSDSTADAPTVTTTEFNTQVACSTAAADIEATMARMQANVLTIARCYEKGA